MTPETAALMADYNRWMNERLYAAALTLPEAEVSRDTGAFFGSLLGTLNHIAAGDTIWLHRFAGAPGDTVLGPGLEVFPCPTALRQPMAPSLHELRAYRARLDDLIVRWAGTLTNVWLESPLRYRSMGGQARTMKLAHLVQHFFNHQTHHRGQASTLLFQAGVDVGVTDLLAVIPSDPTPACPTQRILS